MMFTAINTKTIEYDENIYMKYLLIVRIIAYKLTNKNSIIKDDLFYSYINDLN